MRVIVQSIAPGRDDAAVVFEGRAGFELLVHVEQHDARGAIVKVSDPAGNKGELVIKGATRS